MVVGDDALRYRVVHAIAIRQIAGHMGSGTGQPSAVPRLLAFLGHIGIGPGIADRGHAIGKPHPALRLAHRAHVTVHFKQARKRRISRCIDVRCDVRSSSVDRDDTIVFDCNVDVGPVAITYPIKQTPNANDVAPRGLRPRVLQSRGNILRNARRRIEAYHPVTAHIDDVLTARAPRRIVREFVGELSRFGAGLIGFIQLQLPHQSTLHVGDRLPQRRQRYVGHVSVRCRDNLVHIAVEHIRGDKLVDAFTIATGIRCKRGGCDNATVRTPRDGLRGNWSVQRCHRTVL